MDRYDTLFEDIRDLCEEAERLNLPDVALVLEFTLDVFLKETDQRVHEKRQERLKTHHWSQVEPMMPLTELYKKVS